jgi:hypothetical protein
LLHCIDDYWQSAFYAFVIYTRAAAEHTNTTVSDLCHRLGHLHDINISTASPPTN